MKRSEELKQIIPAFLKTQKALKPVTKDRVNPFAESSYATLDAILSELLPKLNENGILMTQEPVFEEAEGGALSIGIETTLFHESGEWIAYEPFFMQLERGAKMNMAQSVGSVITYSRRYAVGAIFGISTDEDKDGVNKIDSAKKENEKNGYGKKEYTKKDPVNKSEPVKPAKDLTLEEAKKTVLGFGKHKGKTIEDLAKNESSYMRWLLDNSKDDLIKQAVKLVGKDLKRQQEEDSHNQTKQEKVADPNQPDPVFEGVEYNDEDIPF